MVPEGVERKLVAIMFTDILGYTALMAESEEKGLRARERHRSLVRPVVQQYHGQSIEARGDESLSVFPSVLDAVNCALAIQAKLEDDPELKLHIGIHSGDIVVQGGEVSGDGVNIASRICSLSDGGDLFVSGDVYRSIRNQPGIETVPHGEQKLKNVPESVAIYAISGRPAQPRAIPKTLSQPRPRGVRVLSSAVAVLIGIALGAGWWVCQPAPDLSPIRSIAVLPFADMSPGGDQEYFADGMSDELINRLSRIEDLRVVARTSAFAFKRTNVDIREIGERLDVGAVVEGSVRKAGDRLRITAQLVQVADGFHLWSETYERLLDDVFAIQDEVSRAIADALEVRLDSTQASKPPTADLRAYELYLMGRFFWNQRTEEGARKAIQYLEQALELDSDFALAYSGLADAYSNLWRFGYDTSQEVRSKAADYATEALALDDALAEGHASLGYILMNRLDWVQAEQELRRSIELNPGYATAHHWYGRMLIHLGRREEALAAIRRAVEVDPLSASVNANVGQLLVAAGEFDAAIDRLSRAFELSPSLPINFRLELAYAYLQRGDEQEALETFLGQSFPPEVEAVLRDTYRHDGIRGVLRRSVELQVARTQKPCTELTYIGAALFAYLGERDQALECLEQTLEEGNPPQMLSMHPLYHGLRSDPRFTAILVEMGLED